MPDNVWSHLHLAVIYGQTGERDRASQAVARILELDPHFGENAWQELRAWFYEEDFIATYVDGLRKAGMAIPDEPKISQ